MAGWTPSMASQCATNCQSVDISTGSPSHTGKVHVAWHLGQGRIDELLKLDLLVVNVKQRLARPETGLAKAQRSCRVVSVKRLGVEHAQGEGDVVDGERRAARGAHQAQALDDDLADTILDVLRERLGRLLVERSDADRLGHVLDVFGIPQKLGHFGCHGVDVFRLVPANAVESCGCESWCCVRCSYLAPAHARWSIEKWVVRASAMRV